MNKNIGLISTLQTNIGDDLIRLGIQRLIQDLFKESKIQYEIINKHKPLSIYPNFHPYRWAQHLPRGRRLITSSIGKYLSLLGKNKFNKSDLIIQCGAPVAWPGCHNAEWVEPLWHQVVGRLASELPVMNLAAGSCYPWKDRNCIVSNLDSKDSSYLRDILSYCSLTTARDKLAEDIFTHLGSKAPLLPCTAFVSAHGLPPANLESDLILINYMEGAGHWDWGQNIIYSEWQLTIKKLINSLHERYDLAFLCHSEEEYHLVKKVDPKIKRVWPKNIEEYFGLIASASAAVCNRMHATIGLASIGIPSIAVGTDTRLYMVNETGLPYFYVNDISFGKLENELENLIKTRFQNQEQLLELRKNTWIKYKNHIQEVVDTSS